MPTKCTARKVSEAMDEIEAELDKARPFIEKAMAKARKIRGLPHLPNCIDDRLSRQVHEVEGRRWGPRIQT